MDKEQIIDIESLQQDEHNFNKGTEKGQELMERSFKELGAGRSVLIDKNGNIIAGNKSQKAAIAAGIKKVRIIETDGTELVAVKRTDIDIDSKEGRELALADNLTQQVNLAWDEAEMQQVSGDFGLDLPDWGYELEGGVINETEEEAIERKKREFEEKMSAGELSEDDPEYQEFLQKFEAKKTTDDCYTPDLVYDALAEWVATEYNLSRSDFVRPFYPGGDYQKEIYKYNDIVVDNPPFSILASIIDWFNEHGVKYFLFGPQLTLLGTSANRCSCIAVGVQITYANGANVSTSFATNLEPDDVVVRTDARLFKMVNDANEKNQELTKKNMPIYYYPKNVVMAPLFHQLSRYGIEFCIRKGECYLVSELDSQKAKGKSIYGKGYLISNRLLAEREKAEREKAEREDVTTWELSEHEKEIIKGLK